MEAEAIEGKIRRMIQHGGAGGNEDGYTVEEAKAS
jgi:hypothetical protein